MLIHRFDPNGSPLWHTHLRVGVADNDGSDNERAFAELLKPQSGEPYPPHVAAELARLRDTIRRLEQQVGAQPDRWVTMKQAAYELGMTEAALRMRLQRRPDERIKQKIAGVGVRINVTAAKRLWFR